MFPSFNARAVLSFLAAKSSTLPETGTFARRTRTAAEALPN